MAINMLGGYNLTDNEILGSITFHQANREIALFESY